MSDPGDRWPPATGSVEPDARWIAVVDYGAGNLRSLGGALDSIGARWRLADRPAALEGAAAIVLPGVGAAAPAMRALAGRGLDAALAGTGVPLLGICLGMQLLCERSSEGEPVECLGLVPGVVEPLPEGLKRPHMGWNEVDPVAVRDASVPGSAMAGQPAVDTLDPDRLRDWFYFAHSYAAVCDEADTLAWTEYGGRRIAAAIGRGRVWGVQFHPEKSADAGLALLSRFWERVREGVS